MDRRLVMKQALDYMAGLGFQKSLNQLRLPVKKPLD
jgi:hypothetical protein